MPDPRTILVVDDDADIRDALGHVLEDEGYDVLLASNGVDALRILRDTDPPRLILLDLMMPVMNGWQFRTEQLRDEALAAIPVLVISADRAVASKAGSIDAQGYLQKPIQLDRLLAAIAPYFD